MSCCISACGGGGGSGDSADEDSTPSDILISGKITFDFIPATQTSGLDYSSTTQKPV